jgi:hypothetical protein
MLSDDMVALDGMTLSEVEIALDLHTRERIPVDKYTAFSWSASRHATLEACARRYYLNYYGARRVRDAKHRVVSAVWWLKQVQTLRMWIGTAIHIAAAEAVRALAEGREMAREDIVARAGQVYRAGVAASRRGAKFEGRWIALFEHVYPAGPFSADAGIAGAIVTDLAHALVESDAYATLRERAGEVREVDPPFQSFTLPGDHALGSVRVFAIPDVLLYDGTHVLIIDWKSGDVERAALHDQAGVYTLYAHRAYGAPDESIGYVLADLAGGGQSVSPPGGPPTVAEAEAFAQGSIRRMIDLMEDVKTNTVRIKEFPRTSDLAQCAFCAFKRVCWRHDLPESDVSDG